MSALGPFKPEWILELRHALPQWRNQRSPAQRSAAIPLCAPLRDGTFACRPSSGVIAIPSLAAGEGPPPTGAAL